VLVAGRYRLLDQSAAEVLFPPGTHRGGDHHLRLVPGDAHTGRARCGLSWTGRSGAEGFPTARRPLVDIERLRHSNGPGNGGHAAANAADPIRP
jgi:hypothetical protein